MYIHVKQAIKILLPREYILQCRQERHWASTYLLGKKPLNPKHDIYKYCDVTLKVVQKGKTNFRRKNAAPSQSGTLGMMESKSKKVDEEAGPQHVTEIDDKPAE